MVTILKSLTNNYKIPQQITLKQGVQQSSGHCHAASGLLPPSLPPPLSLQQLTECGEDPGYQVEPHNGQQPAQPSQAPRESLIGRMLLIKHLLQDRERMKLRSTPYFLPIPPPSFLPPSPPHIHTQPLHVQEQHSVSTVCGEGGHHWPWRLPPHHADLETWRHGNMKT